MRTYLERFALGRDVSPGYVSQIRYAVDRFGRWLGRAPALSDFQEELVNRWILSMLEDGIKQETVRSYRRHLLVLWRAAFDERLIDLEPRRIRKVKPDRPPTAAPSQDQVAQVLKLTQRLTGKFKRSRVNKAAFWRAWVLTNWDFPVRLGDMCELRLEHIASDGAVCMIQHKTGYPVHGRLQPETIAAIHDTFPPKRVRIFGDALCRDQIMRQFRLFRDAAQILIPGSTKLLRRASATAIEIHHPGAAMSHLGHRTPGLAYQHYVDMGKVQENKPRPPKLA